MDLAYTRGEHSSLLDTLFVQLQNSAAWGDRRRHKWLIGQETFDKLAKDSLTIESDDTPVYLFGMEVRVVMGEGAAILRKFRLT